MSDLIKVLIDNIFIALSIPFLFLGTLKLFNQDGFELRNFITRSKDGDKQEKGLSALEYFAIAIIFVLIHIIYDIYLGKSKESEAGINNTNKESCKLGKKDILDLIEKINNAKDSVFIEYYPNIISDMCIADEVKNIAKQKANEIISKSNIKPPSEETERLKLEINNATTYQELIALRSRIESHYNGNPPLEISAAISNKRVLIDNSLADSGENNQTQKNLMEIERLKATINNAIDYKEVVNLKNAIESIYGGNVPSELSIAILNKLIATKDSQVADEEKYPIVLEASEPVQQQIQSQPEPPIQKQIQSPPEPPVQKNQPQPESPIQQQIQPPPESAQQFSDQYNNNQSTISNNSFYIQLFTSSSNSKAEGIADSFRKEGYDNISILQVNIKNKIAYRVYISGFSSKLEAEKFQEKMKSRYKKNKYVNESKIYSD